MANWAHSQTELDAEIDEQTDFETFFGNAPELNPSRKLITGVICGIAFLMSILTGQIVNVDGGYTTQ